MNTLHFVIAGLACWRLASLAANEDGAFHIFRRFRTWTLHHVATHPRGFLARFHFDEGLHCEWCNSVWFGAGIAAGWYYFGEVFIWLVCLPLALSTVAIILKYTVQTLEQVREYYERLNASVKALADYRPVGLMDSRQAADKALDDALRAAEVLRARVTA